MEGWIFKRLIFLSFDGVMVLEIVDIEMRFYEEMYCLVYEFLWLFRVWDINRS